MKLVQALKKGLKQGIGDRQKVPAWPEAAPELTRWFDGDFGSRVLGAEQAVLDQALSCLFGYHLIQLSVLPALRLYQNSRICRCTRVGEASDGVDVTALPEALPFADDTVDLVLLHHLLEFSPDPHQLLSEVSRVVIPEGHIVVMGFDPWSLSGVMKPPAQLLQCGPQWRRHSLRAGRLQDWLQLLGFDVTQLHFGASKVPLWSERAPDWLQLPFGHFYCMVARKKVASLRWITPKRVGAPFMGRPLRNALTARARARLSLIRQPDKPTKP